MCVGGVNSCCSAACMCPREAALRAAPSPPARFACSSSPPCCWVSLELGPPINISVASSPSWPRLPFPTSRPPSQSPPPQSSPQRRAGIDSPCGTHRLCGCSFKALCTAARLDLGRILCGRRQVQPCVVEVRLTSSGHIRMDGCLARAEHPNAPGSGRDGCQPSAFWRDARYVYTHEARLARGESQDGRNIDH